MQTVSLAGREYELKFFLADKSEIEKKLRKYLHDAMWSGLTDDQTEIMAVGLRHKARKITPLAVQDLFQKELDKGGDYMLAVYVMNRAVLESHILGRTDPEEVERMFRTFFGAKYEEFRQQHEAALAEVGTVRAAE